MIENTYIDYKVDKIYKSDKDSIFLNWSSVQGKTTFLNKYLYKYVNNNQYKTIYVSVEYVNEFNINYELHMFWEEGDSHIVTIKVDPDNIYPESNELDNKWEQVVEVEEVPQDPSPEPIQVPIKRRLTRCIE